MTTSPEEPTEHPAGPPERAQRFLTLRQVADELNVSVIQARALVRSRDLVGIQIGGRGQWRVERVRLEQYIQGLYAQGAAEDFPDDSPDTDD